MAVRKDARPNPSANKPATYSRRWFLHKKETVKRLTKKVEKLRAKFNLMKELHEKDKAEVEEKEREYAQGRRWNDLALKEDACVRRGIDITLDLIDAQDEGDRVRANGLMQSLRELVSEHIGEKVALVSAVQE